MRYAQPFPHAALAARSAFRTVTYLATLFVASPSASEPSRCTPPTTTYPAPAGPPFGMATGRAQGTFANAGPRRRSGPTLQNRPERASLARLGRRSPSRESQHELGQRSPLPLWTKSGKRRGFRSVWKAALNGSLLRFQRCSSDVGADRRRCTAAFRPKGAPQRRTPAGSHVAGGIMASGPRAAPAGGPSPAARRPARPAATASLALGARGCKT